MIGFGLSKKGLSVFRLSKKPDYPIKGILC